MTGFLTIWYNCFQGVDIVLLDVIRNLRIIASTWRSMWNLYNVAAFLNSISSTFFPFCISVCTTVPDNSVLLLAIHWPEQCELQIIIPQWENSVLPLQSGTTEPAQKGICTPSDQSPQMEQQWTQELVQSICPQIFLAYKLSSSDFLFLLHCFRMFIKAKLVHGFPWTLIGDGDTCIELPGQYHHIRLNEWVPFL